MAKKKQKVVRWRKVLKHMGACGTLTEVYRLAGEPADLDGMLEYARSDEGRWTAGSVVAFLDSTRFSRLGSRKALSSPDQADLAAELYGDYWGFDSPTYGQVTDKLVAGIKTILERESDARGLTEWI